MVQSPSAGTSRVRGYSYAGAMRSSIRVGATLGVAEWPPVDAEGSQQ